MNKPLQQAKVIALGIVIAFTASYALAWTGPTALPPNGNVPAPLNVGTTTQAKLGDLVLNGLSVNAATILSGALQIPIGNPVAGDVLTSQDASGTVGWAAPASRINTSNTPAYQSLLMGAVPGNNEPIMCKLNVSSGLTTCADITPATTFNAFASAFTATTTGDYQINQLLDISGVEYATLCRMNKIDGSVQCTATNTWGTPVSVFSPGAPGPYSMNTYDYQGGYSFPMLCRTNLSSGLVECKYNDNGWSSMNPPGI